MEDLNIRLKVFGLQAFHLALIVIVGVTGVIGMARIKSEFRLSNENHTVSLVQLSGILDDVHQIETLITKAALEPREISQRALVADVARLESERTHFWFEYIATTIGSDEEAVIRRSERAWQAYLGAIRPTLGASPASTGEPVSAVRLADAGRNLEVVRGTVKQLISLQGHAADSGYDAANRLFLKLGILDLVLVCAGLGLACLLLFWDFVRLRRSVVR